MRTATPKNPPPEHRKRGLRGVLVVISLLAVLELPTFAPVGNAAGNSVGCGGDFFTDVQLEGDGASGSRGSQVQSALGDFALEFENPFEGALPAGKNPPLLDDNFACPELAGDAPPVLLPAAVGTLPGASSVSKNGAFQYGIDLEVPSGVNGMQPKLSVDYASSGANGSLGLRFSLSTGAATMHRCNKNQSLDNSEVSPPRFLGDDAICLGGMRILPSPHLSDDEGDVFHTEQESYQKIVRLGDDDNPSGWRVYHYDGRISTFGQSDAHRGARGEAWVNPYHWNPQEGEAGLALPRLPEGGDGPMTSSWFLKKTVDRFGNRIEYDYDIEPSDELPNEVADTARGLLRRISYGSADTLSRSVELSYEARPDFVHTPGFQQNISTLKRRLSAIFVRAHDEILYNYRLVYNDSAAVSRLDTVTRCAAAADATCMPPTQFTWTDLPDDNEVTHSVGEWSFGDADEGDQWGSQRNRAFDGISLPGDLNGDGLQDFARCRRTLDEQFANSWENGYGKVQVWLSDGEELIRHETEQDCWADGWRQEKPNLFDIDGDGRAEIVAPTAPCNFVGDNCVRYTSYNFLRLVDDEDDFELVTSLNWGSDIHPTRFGDLDGDGLVDAVSFTYNLDTDDACITVRMNRQGVFAAAERTKYCTAHDEDDVFVAPMNSAENPSKMEDLIKHLQIVDVDGDGAGEILMPRRESDGDVMHRWNIIDRVRNWAPQQWRVYDSLLAGPTADSHELGSTPAMRSADFNGDGLADFFWLTGDLWHLTELVVQLNLGNYRFSEPVVAYNVDTLLTELDDEPSSVPLGRSDWENVAPFNEDDWENAGGVVVDWNRDGKSDLLFPHRGRWAALLWRGDAEPHVVGATQDDFQANQIQTVMSFSAVDTPINFWHDELHDTDNPSTWISPFAAELGSARAASFGVRGRNFTTIDINGDGVMDFVQTGFRSEAYTQEHDDPQYSLFLHTFLRRSSTSNSSPVPNVVTRFENGLGRKTFVDYAPSVDPDVYVHTVNQQQCIWPLRCTRGPLTLTKHVKEQYRSHPDDRFQETTYRYTDYVGHRLGRAAPGMTSTWQRNEVNGTWLSRDFGTKQMINKSEYRYLFALANKAIREEQVTEFDTEAHRFRNHITTNEYYVARRPTGYRTELRESIAQTQDRQMMADGEPQYDFEKKVTTTTSFSTLSKEIVQQNVVTEGRPTEGSFESMTKNLSFVYDLDTWFLPRPSQKRRYRRTSGKSWDNTTTFTTWDTERFVPTFEKLHARTSAPEHHYYGYDSAGNTSWKTVTDSNGKNGRASLTIYDADKIQPQCEFNALGHLIATKWHTGFGVPALIRDANGAVSSTQIDYFGRQRVMHDPTGTHTTRVYAPGTPTRPLRIIESKDGKTQTQTFMDAAENEVTIAVLNTPSNAATELSVEEKVYDDNGNVLSHSLPRLETEQESIVTYRYDGLGREVEKTRPDGFSFTTIYSMFDITKIDDDEATTRVMRNAIGQTVRITDAFGGENRYEYDVLGNLSKITDAEGNVRTIKSDRRGNPTVVTDDTFGTVATYYNTWGEPYRSDKIGRNSLNEAVRVDMTYDRLGRMTRRSSGDYAESWIYDAGDNALGLLVRTKSPDAVRTFTYDNIGRRVSEAVDIGQRSFETSWDFDAYGRLNDKVFADGLVVHHEYAGDGSLMSLRKDSVDGKLIWRSKKRDGIGRHLVELLEDDTIYLTRKFDDVSRRLVSIDAAHTETLEMLQDLEYEYYDDGNLKSRTDKRPAGSGSSDTFSYDLLNRVTQNVNRWASGKKTHKYTYSAAGNLLQKQAGGAGAMIYDGSSEFAGPYAVSSSDEGKYKYDEFGRSVSTPRYDASYTTFDKIARLTAGKKTSTSYAYDADQSRIKKVVREFTIGLSGLGGLGGVDGDIDSAKIESGKVLATHFTPTADYEEIVRADSSQMITRISNGERVVYEYVVNAPKKAVLTSSSGKDATKTTYIGRYLLADHLGSTDVVVDGNGNVLDRPSSDAFGTARHENWKWLESKETLEAPVSRIGFTGHNNDDESGLIDMGGRLFDPIIGRFTTPDPVGQDAYDTQGLNLYSYAVNNPVNRTDPSGFQSPDDDDDWSTQEYDWSADGALAYPGVTLDLPVIDVNTGQEVGDYDASADGVTAKRTRLPTGGTGRETHLADTFGEAGDSLSKWDAAAKAPVWAATKALGQKLGSVPTKASQFLKGAGSVVKDLGKGLLVVGAGVEAVKMADMTVHNTAEGRTGAVLSRVAIYAALSVAVVGGVDGVVGGRLGINNTANFAADYVNAMTDGERARVVANMKAGGYGEVAPIRMAQSAVTTHRNLTVGPVATPVTKAPTSLFGGGFGGGKF